MFQAENDCETNLCVLLEFCVQNSQDTTIYESAPGLQPFIFPQSVVGRLGEGCVKTWVGQCTVVFGPGSILGPAADSVPQLSWWSQLVREGSESDLEAGNGNKMWLYLQNSSSQDDQHDITQSLTSPSTMWRFKKKLFGQVDTIQYHHQAVI